jgi:hypothetical protein
MEQDIGGQLGRVIDAWQQLHGHPDYMSHSEDADNQVMHAPAMMNGVPMIDPQTGQPHMQPHPQLTQMYRTAMMEEKRLQDMHNNFQQKYQQVGGPSGEAYLRANPTKPVAEAQVALRDTAQKMANPISQAVL